MSKCVHQLLTPCLFLHLCKLYQFFQKMSSTGAFFPFLCPFLDILQANWLQAENNPMYGMFAGMMSQFFRDAMASGNYHAVILDSTASTSVPQTPLPTSSHCPLHQHRFPCPSWSIHRPPYPFQSLFLGCGDSAHARPQYIPCSMPYQQPPMCSYLVISQ